MLCLSQPYIIIIRKLATHPLYNLFPSRTGPMKQGLCSVVLEEAVRCLSSFGRVLVSASCQPSYFTCKPLVHCSIWIQIVYNGIMEGPSPPTLRKLSKVSRWSLVLQSFFTRFMRENILSTLAFVNSMMTIDE